MKRYLFFVSIVFLVSPIVSAAQTIDFDVKGVGLGIPYQTVLRQLGKPLSSRKRGTNPCGGAKQVLRYSGLIITLDEGEDKQSNVVFGYAEASNAGVNCIEHFADLYRSTSTKRNEVYALYRDRRLRTMTADEVYKVFSTLRDMRDKKYYDETLRTLAQNKTCVITNFAEQGHSKEVFEFTDLSRRRFKTKKQLEQLDAAIKEKQRQRNNQDYRATDTTWKGLLQDVADLHRAGVPLVAGTQSVHEDITSPGTWLHDELYWFVQAGLSPFEALKTATVNPAKFMRREKDLGTIEKGNLADLILLDANPLLDISNTRKINAVVAGGRYLSREFLDRMLSDVEAKAKMQ